MEAQDKGDFPRWQGKSESVAALGLEPNLAIEVCCVRASVPCPQVPLVSVGGLQEATAMLQDGVTFHKENKCLHIEQ